jgi:hypothetical protein
MLTAIDREISPLLSSIINPLGMPVFESIDTENGESELFSAVIYGPNFLSGLLCVNQLGHQELNQRCWENILEVLVSP